MFISPLPLLGKKYKQQIEVERGIGQGIDSQSCDSNFLHNKVGMRGARSLRNTTSFRNVNRRLALLEMSSLKHLGYLFGKPPNALKQLPCKVFFKYSCRPQEFVLAQWVKIGEHLGISQPVNMGDSPLEEEHLGTSQWRHLPAIRKWKVKNGNQLFQRLVRKKRKKYTMLLSVLVLWSGLKKNRFLKSKRGKKMSLRVSPSMSYNALRNQAEEKWNNFHSNLYEKSQPYNLVYEDGSKNLFLRENYLH